MDMYAGLGLCAVGALVFTAFYRAYFFLPYKEIRLRSIRGAHIYKGLGLVARHGRLARGLIRLITYIFGVIAVMIISREYDSLRSFVLVSMFALALLYLKNTTIRSFSKLAAKTAPFFDWILSRIRPAANLWARRPFRRPRVARTELFTKEDLIEFIETQKAAKNNRIDHGDLNHALHALEIRTKKIKEHMVPFKEIQLVNMKEPIGPILLSELHKTGFSRFPVRGNAKREIIGILSLDELADYERGGLVTNAMDPKVLYVREDQKLEQVLRAYTKTGKPMYMVIDIREKVVGLITVGDVLKELAGEANVYSDFDEYDNPDAVAHS